MYCHVHQKTKNKAQGNKNNHNTKNKKQHTQKAKNQHKPPSSDVTVTSLWVKEIHWGKFFSVQRRMASARSFNMFQKHVAYGINWLIKSRKGQCCSGRKSKLVEDRYIVLCTVTFIRKQKTKHKETKTTTIPKTKNNTHKKQKPTQTTKQWRDRYQVYGWKRSIEARR